MEYHLSGHRALQMIWASKVFSKAIYLRRKSTLNSLRGHVTEFQTSLVPNWWDGRLFWSNTLWRVHEQAAGGYCRIINDKLLLRSSLIVKEFEIHSILCLLICRRLIAHNTHTHTQWWVYTYPRLEWHVCRDWGVLFLPQKPGIVWFRYYDICSVTR